MSRETINQFYRQHSIRRPGNGFRGGHGDQEFQSAVLRLFWTGRSGKRILMTYLYNNNPFLMVQYDFRYSVIVFAVNKLTENNFKSAH